MVIDFTVDYCGDGLGGVPEWLVAGRCKVVDLKAGIPQTWKLLVSMSVLRARLRYLGSLELEVDRPICPSWLIHFPLVSGPRWCTASRL